MNGEDYSFGEIPIPSKMR